MNRPGAWWGATVGAVLAYTIAVFMPSLPRLYFFPRPGVWGTTALAGEPAIMWYGWMIYAAAGGLGGIVVGGVINRRPPWISALLVAATSLCLLAWHERHWFLR